MLRFGGVVLTFILFASDSLTTIRSNQGSNCPWGGGVPQDVEVGYIDHFSKCPVNVQMVIT